MFVFLRFLERHSFFLSVKVYCRYGLRCPCNLPVFPNPCLRRIIPRPAFDSFHALVVIAKTREVCLCFFSRSKNVERKSFANPCQNFFQTNFALCSNMASNSAHRHPWWIFPAYVSLPCAWLESLPNCSAESTTGYPGADSLIFADPFGERATVQLTEGAHLEESIHNPSFSCSFAYH